MTRPADTRVRYRGYDPTDASALLELVNRVYGRSPGFQHWSWKYDQNPAGPALSCVVEKDGKIVAHLGGQPIRFVIRGRVRTAVQDVDDAVDQYQRTFQGVFHINKCRRDLHRQHRVDFMYGFAIDVTSKVSQMQYGYGRVSSIPRLVKVLDYRPYLGQSSGTKFLAPLAAVAQRVQEMRRPRHTALPDGMALEEIVRFDDRFDRFWEHVKHDYPIMVVRDAIYLNWRYVDIPDMQTTRLALVRDDTREVLGFSVLSEDDRELPRGRILDLVTPRQEDGRLAAALITRALEHFRSRGMALAVCWAFPHCHVSYPLSAAGFRARRNPGRDVMFRNAELDHPAIPTEFALDQTNWFLAIGDSDLT